MIPRGKSKDRQEFKADRDMGVAHMKDFISAVRTRRQPTCSADDAFRSTATVQLAMIAYETMSPVRWDAAARQIPGNPAAASLLKREYRRPWAHPYPGK